MAGYVYRGNQPIGGEKTFEHGTYSGYQAHRRRKESACDACRAAAAEYNREWLNRDPKNRQSQYNQVKARDLALAELGRRHRVEYQQLRNQYMLELRRGA